MKEYSLKCIQFERFAPPVVADSKARMSNFMSSISKVVVKECRTSMLEKEIEISRLMVHAQYIEK